MESKRDYLERRSFEEEAAAGRASSAKVRELHMELATRYRDAATAVPEQGEADLAAESIRPKEFRILE